MKILPLILVVLFTCFGARTSYASTPCVLPQAQAGAPDIVPQCAIEQARMDVNDTGDRALSILQELAIGLPSVTCHDTFCSLNVWFTAADWIAAQCGVDGFCSASHCYFWGDGVQCVAISLQAPPERDDQN